MPEVNVEEVDSAVFSRTCQAREAPVGSSLRHGRKDDESTLMHPRIAALDIGDKRIGLAVSDALLLTAQPLAVVQRASVVKDIAAILELLSEYDVGRVVAGLPIQMDGIEGEQARRVRSFGDAFTTKTGLDLAYQDERLTTAAGERLLVEAGVRRDRRRRVIDKTAATLILQAYLDSPQR